MVICCNNNNNNNNIAPKVVTSEVLSRPKECDEDGHPPISTPQIIPITCDISKLMQVMINLLLFAHRKLRMVSNESGNLELLNGHYFALFY